MTISWKHPDPSTLSAYQKSYIDYVPGGDLVRILEQNMEASIQLAKNIPKEKLSYRYAEGKWSIPEIFVHISDCERIFSYRILRISRGDKTPLAGFEQDEYAKEANVNERNFEDILEEFIAVRRATISLLKSFNNNLIERTGIANNTEISVLKIAYMLAGHEMHHIKVMKEKYLSA